MIARREYTAAAFVKPRDAFAISFSQPVAGIDREKPELVEVCLVKRAQDWIVACGIRFAIARGDLIERGSLFMSDRAQVFAQQRKPVDVPIVFNGGNSGL